MKSTSNRKFNVDFTYVVKASGREVFLSKVLTGENIEEIAIKLERIYNKPIIKEYRECTNSESTK